MVGSVPPLNAPVVWPVTGTPVMMATVVSSTPTPPGCSRASPAEVEVVEYRVMTAHGEKTYACTTHADGMVTVRGNVTRPAGVLETVALYADHSGFVLADGAGTAFHARDAGAKKTLTPDEHAAEVSNPSCVSVTVDPPLFCMANITPVVTADVYG